MSIIADKPERKAVDRVVLRLPMPPSSNAVWAQRKGGGVRLSDRYRRWLTDAGWRINVQKPGRIAGGYVLTMWLPAVSRMDQDNAIAGVSDILQSFGIIGNDRDAEETHLHWHGASNDLVLELRPFVGASRVQRPCVALEVA